MVAATPLWENSMTACLRFMCCNQLLLFFFCPGILAYVWPQVMVPALPALLANPALISILVEHGVQAASNGTPVAFPMLSYQPAAHTASSEECLDGLLSAYPLLIHCMTPK